MRPRAKAIAFRTIYDLIMVSYHSDYFHMMRYFNPSKFNRKLDTNPHIREEGGPAIVLVTLVETGYLTHMRTRDRAVSVLQITPKFCSECFPTIRKSISMPSKKLLAKQEEPDKHVEAKKEIEAKPETTLAAAMNKYENREELTFKEATMVADFLSSKAHNELQRVQISRDVFSLMG